MENDETQNPQDQEPTEDPSDQSELATALPDQPIETPQPKPQDSPPVQDQSAAADVAQKETELEEARREHSERTGEDTE
jgi:hypothetical protein